MVNKISANAAKILSESNSERLREKLKTEIALQIESAYSDIEAAAKSGDFYALPQIKPEFLHKVKEELESSGYLVLTAETHMYVSWEGK